MVVVVLVFLAWPMIWTFVLSFTNMTVTGPAARHYNFIGLDNYRELFTKESGLSGAVWRSLYYLFVSAYLGQAALGFLLASLMQRCSRALRAAVGAVIVVAWLIPEIVIAWMWFVLLSDGGVAQQAMHAVGMHYTSWLFTHPMLSVSLANAWRGVASRTCCSRQR